MKPKIAVVILNWNGKQLLEQFLPSVVSHSSEARIYVADNASTDDSIAYVQATYPDVKLIVNDQNYGYAQGYNKALEQVDEEYICLLNSDVEVTAGWLAPILSIFENQLDVAIIQPKILDYKEKTSFEYAGAAGGFIDKYGFPFCRGRVFDTIEKDQGQYSDIASIFWASGACLFIRKATFVELQGFDTAFFAHQEEIDLCWRAFNKEKKILYCGLSTVYHLGGATLAYGNPRKTYLNFRNSLLMMLKNMPRKGMFSTLFVRLCMDGIAGVRLMLQGKPKHCFAIVRAHFGFYKRARGFYIKRSDLQRSDYYNVKNIVYQYFIKKKQTYNSIFLTKK